MTQFEPIDLDLVDLDLVDQVVQRIPAWTWSRVKEALITNLVDLMPSTVLEKLTNDPMGFEMAEEILHNYYQDEEHNSDLIVDSFKIIGEENTLYLLDSLQLDKIESPSDTAPCSIDPQ